MSFYTKEKYHKIADSLEYATKALIGGKLVDSVSGRTYSTCNPATGNKLADVTCCCAEDVDLAVRAAKQAYDDRRWAGLSPAERKTRLYKLAALVEAHTDELAVMEAVDAGKPIYDTARSDVPGSVESILWTAEATDKVQDHITKTDPANFSMAVREPFGVAAIIVPWNFPLYITVMKSIPALAAGNSVIIKPAQLTSLTALKLGELALEAGLPDGVINILPGSGREVGNALAMHPDVGVISFPGSTAVGRNLLECSARSNLKRVLLELGGKSPVVVMPDIDDYDYVADRIVYAAIAHSGLNCTATARVLIHESIKDKLLEKIVDKAKTWTCGDILDPADKMGAMVSKEHMESVLSYIALGKQEKAELILGGNRVHEETGGYFIEPTIFDHMTPDMRISREEIFGPVLGVTTFRDIDEAIRLANDTEYGLLASVYSNDLNAVMKLTRSICAGTVSVNCYSEGDCTSPFGGFKQSGFNCKDKSLWSIEQFTELKSIWMQLRGYNSFN